MAKRKKRTKATRKWIDVAWFMIVLGALGASVKQHLKDRSIDDRQIAKSPASSVMRGDLHGQ